MGAFTRLTAPAPVLSTDPALLAAVEHRAVSYKRTLTEPPAEDAHDGVFIHDPHIAHQGEFQPPGHGEPLHGGDHRLTEHHA